MFTVDSGALHADSLTPTALWSAESLPTRTRAGVPALEAFRRGASLVYDFEIASGHWLRSGSTVDDAVAVSTDIKLVPASSPHALLARLRHAEMFSQFRAVRRYAEPVDVWPEPSVAWTLLLGMLIVIVRRVPLHSRPNGMWIAGDRGLGTPNS